MKTWTHRHFVCVWYFFFCCIERWMFCWLWVVHNCTDNEIISFTYNTIKLNFAPDYVPFRGNIPLRPYLLMFKIMANTLSSSRHSSHIAMKYSDIECFVLTWLTLSNEHSGKVFDFFSLLARAAVVPSLHSLTSSSSSQASCAVYIYRSFNLTRISIWVKSKLDQFINIGRMLIHVACNLQ